MEKYLEYDTVTLDGMLAACTDFKERQNIRGALRELKGLKLDGDTAVTYSFGQKSVKRATSLTSPISENGRIFPKQTNYKSVDENSFLERKYSTKAADRTSNSRESNGRLGNETIETNVTDHDQGVNTTSVLNDRINVITNRINIFQNDRISKDITESDPSKANNSLKVKSSNTKARNRRLGSDIVEQDLIKKDTIALNGYIPNRSLKVKGSSFSERNEKDNSADHSNVEVVKPNLEKTPDEISRYRSDEKEILSESFVNRVNKIKSTFEKHREEKPKFRSYLYAGTICTPTKQLEEGHVTPVQRCHSVSVVSSEIINNHSDKKESVIKRPVSLSLNGINNDISLSLVSPKTDLNQSPKKPRRISYRTSPFSSTSQSGQLNQISSTVYQNGLKKESASDEFRSDPNSRAPTAINQTGRYSVPILSGEKSLQKHSGRILVSSRTGRLSASNKTDDSGVDNTDGHIGPSDKPPRPVRRSVTNQTTRQLEVESSNKEQENRVYNLNENHFEKSSMRAETAKRHASDSSLIVHNSFNEINNETEKEEVEKLRSKSQGCYSEVFIDDNKMDVGVSIRKPGLFRKNRVDSTDGTKTVRKFRRKGKVEEEPSLSTDIIISPIKSVNGELHHTKSVHGSSNVRRKLPEIPVTNHDHEMENDETVHERTLRLLQERRKDRLGKIIKEKEVVRKCKSPKPKATPEQIKNLQDKLERSDSKRKACRVRRELQLLNRETKLKSPVSVQLEAEFSAIIKAGEAVTEKENVQYPVKRSQSDVCRKPAKMEVSSREPSIERPMSAAAREVDLLLSQSLTPDKKIDLIGSLMQEEAKLQEKLRRSTIFTDKRKMRAEVRHLREKRNGNSIENGNNGVEETGKEETLEGASLPTPTLQRSASVSSGVITYASTPDGNRVTEPVVESKQPAIDELRRQLSETTDYDEKRKIRLALRQLRQQSKDETPIQTGLQRSQSFVHQKPSEANIKSGTQSGSVPVFRSRSVSDFKVPQDHQTGISYSNKQQSSSSKAIYSVQVSDTNSSGKSDKDYTALKTSDNLKRSVKDHPRAALSLSDKPPVPSPKKQSVIANGDARVRPVEAGSLPPRAPKRHSFALGSESKLRNQSNTLFVHGIQHQDSSDSGNDNKTIDSKLQYKFSENQQNGEPKDVKFKSKFANILISGSNIDRRKSTSDLISETRDSYSSLSSHDLKTAIRSETTSFKVTDTGYRAHKSLEKTSVKTDTDNDSRLTPNIEWLEDKKRTIPTPNELDNLMSSMDIEAAFSQILDAVETSPTNGDFVDSQVPDSPIMEEESESSTSSVIELTTIAQSKLNMDNDLKRNTNNLDNHKLIPNESVKTSENDRHNDIQNELGGDSVPQQSVDIMGSVTQNGDLNHVCADQSHGAIKDGGKIVKSEKTIQLRSDLSLDVSQHPETSSAISVIHGNDGTVTIQEVNRKEEGDAIITEWKKVSRSNSKSEVRETDTVVEKRITSPGGNSHVYEKDVSKTKRKLTSRGSEYFSRNHYNIRKRKDLEGMEIVEHELDSESANVSVSKNESWGERSEAKVILNRDGNTEIKPKRLSITKNDTDGKSEGILKVEEKASIKPADRSSAGTKASSGYGSVSPSDDDHDLVSVVEAHLGRPSGCPEVISPLQSVTAIEGSTAILEFKLKGHPAPNLTWYKGDNLVEESSTVKVTFDDTLGKARLEISPVSPEDLGDYKCVLKNSLGTASTCGRLNVKSETSTLPWFQTKLNDITVTEGQSITLECEVSGSDTVMWFKDGIIQRNSPDLRQTFDGKMAKLEIIEVYLDDDGTYSCVITNKAGENGCSCRITVQESQSKDAIVPMFLRKLETQICDEGDTAIFETEVIGSPEPTVAWLVNKMQLTEADCHKMGYDGRIARLVLHKVSLTQGGKIECVAENSSGRVSCDCTLVVQELKKAPSLITQLANVTFTSGKPAILECLVDSEGTPDVCWRKNGLVIGHMLDFKQTYVDGVVKLEIGNACKQDSGKYDCVIRNEHGELQTSCFLTIQEQDLKPETPKPLSKQAKSEKPTMSSVPASFTPKVDNERTIQARSTASKVMLVRQASLRSVNKDNQSAVVKRTSSFHAGILSNDFMKKSPDDNNKTEQKFESATTHLKPRIVNTVDNSAEKVSDSSIILNNMVVDTNESNVETIIGETIDNHGTSPNVSSQIFEKNLGANRIPDIDKSSKKTVTEEKLDLLDMEKGSQKVDISEKYTIDVNSNITKLDNLDTVQNNNGKSLKLEIQIDSNKTTLKSDSGRVAETDSVSKHKEIPACVKRSSIGETDQSPVSRFKAGSDLRRTQSTRTPGSEKPEWLQVKLRKVTNTPLSNSEKKSIEKSTNYNSPGVSTEQSNTPVGVSTELSDTPVSVHREVKLSRSQSARVVNKKTSPVLKDSTNSPSNDPAKRTVVKLTPVSERAKMFLGNESRTPSGKSSPTDIIAKAINLSRAESMKSPIGHRPFVVQRTGSLKAEAKSSQSGDVTLKLSPQQSQGKDKECEPGSTRKAISVWDPTAPTTTKMDYSKITDEEELNKLLSNCDNFEERKKLRSRIKELRDIQMKEWEAKRVEREQHQEDAIKAKHRAADLDKQRRLKAFDAQAKEEYAPKHLEVADKNLKDKYKQADIDKQKKLEAFDRMAGKDVKQSSTVKTDVSTDGRTTTTTRKVETVTTVTGRGAYGRPAEEIAPQMLRQIINTTSPSVGGQLSVKTESWSSRDGVTKTSEKTESWGAKPVNPFKAADAANAKTNPPKAMARSPSAIKTMLLDWCKAMTREYTDKIEITNFSTSWNDGIAFCALIHHFYPDSFDLYALDPKHRRKNFELAFDTAEQKADIAPLLDVEDMVRMKKPDWKCVFTYVQSFYRKLKDHDLNKAKSAES